jgi:hypothetical protein
MYNECEDGHMDTYDVCMSCIDERAAKAGAPYVHLTEPDEYFTPWDDQCPCRNCNVDGAEKTKEADVPQHKKLKEVAIAHLKSAVANQVASSVATVAVAACCSVM